MMKVFVAAAAFAAVFGQDSSAALRAAPEVEAKVTLHKQSKCAKGKKDVTVSAPKHKCLEVPGMKGVYWNAACDIDSKGTDSVSTISMCIAASAAGRNGGCSACTRPLFLHPHPYPNPNAH